MNLTEFVEEANQRGLYPVLGSLLIDEALADGLAIWGGLHAGVRGTVKDCWIYGQETSAMYRLSQVNTWRQSDARSRA